MARKLVFVGASGHVHLVLGELGDHPEVQLAAYAPSFAGEDVGVLAQARGDSPAPAAYSDWRKMLDEERPEIVVVCGRYDQNGPLSIEALERGCHVISEKPAAHNLDEVAALRQLLAQGRLRYGIMLNMRYMPTFFTAHQLVRDGAIGQPVLITAQKSYRWGDSRPNWYSRRGYYGSSMTWIGIHAFDYAKWISGRGYTTVFAHHGNLVHRERPGCQDVSTVLATLDNGGSAVFNLDYLRPATAPTHGDDRLRIAGSRGVLEVRNQAGTLQVINEAGCVDACPLLDPGRSLFGDFIAALDGTGELLVSADDALSITEFAIHAARAADLGRVQHLESARPHH